jgi:ATP adenylyltransferase
MDYLWAPWRMEYIEKPQSEEGCIFCNLEKEIDGPDNLVLTRGSRAFVVLNRFPYTNGHMMIVPHKHVPSLTDLDEATLAELITLTRDALEVLGEVYSAKSFNVGANIGEIAGAGIAEHVHIHVVPRWAGDTSFMTTSANTRVIPESLEKTYKRLRSAWESKTS